jgi:hypothetical protein
MVSVVGQRDHQAAVTDYLGIHMAKTKTRRYDVELI